MIHNPIILNNLDLVLPHKICFQNFSTTINYGSSIGIMGNNGSGKSSLLKLITEISVPKNVVLGYIPQIINKFNNLSGGQRFNKVLTQELQKNPNLLLLDEPTNHLDKHNFTSLMRMLKNYQGTLIVVSHNKEVLSNCNILWHIDNNKVNVFNGNYSDYIENLQQNKLSLEHKLSKIKQQKKDIHDNLMKEQQKVAKSKQSGKKNIANSKWTKMTAGLKTTAAEQSQGKKLKNIHDNTQDILEELQNFKIPEIIIPKFLLKAQNTGNNTVVSISNGKISYKTSDFELSNINLNVFSNTKLAIKGNNGSGKSTLLKGILNLPEVIKEGNWLTPKIEDIAYLDQHYSNLQLNKSVIENISDIALHLNHAEVRDFLNGFLFRKNEEVNALASTLSGGEKARLSLACITIKPPKLLVLDEIINNLDLQTIDYIIKILQDYQGAMIVIAHDDSFLNEIKITDIYEF
ncbi:MAG: ATP-binding cassette domain-containing protein [Alphaproteobacteria bacterium]|jgi:ATPase subunit of ABC transporter with duplicated ATPase domains|nr:ATP-binding cassette domain-containing protein [Alphaproteobacteria bacterium]